LKLNTITLKKEHAHVVVNGLNVITIVNHSYQTPIMHASITKHP